MIAWQNPLALWALSLVAGPILVHLLRSRRAPRVEFPSLRFVQPSTASSTRFRLPSDWLLLCLRCAVVALAATALARPVVLLPARMERWNGRVARAVIVDASSSVRSAGSSQALSASAAADAEVSGAFLGRRIDAGRLAEGLADAVAWLNAAPPARREIVVISDFHEGAFDAGDLSAVPAHVGVRLAPIGALPASRTVAGMELLAGSGGDARRVRIELTPSGTRAAIEAAPVAAAAGLRVEGRPGTAGNVRALVEAVAASGTPSPSASEPLALYFDGASPPHAERTEPPAWMLRTILRLGADDDLLSAAAGATAAGAIPAAPGHVVVFRDRRGRVLVTAAVLGRELVLQAAVDSSSFLAARLVRGALDARQGGVARTEDEVRAIERTVLASLSRSPGGVQADAWRRADTSDARWVWLVVLILLGVEHLMRRPREVATQGRRDVAA